MKVLVVDGLNLIRRISAAVPLKNGNGKQDHMEDVIRSTRHSMARALAQHTPSHCIMVMEQGGETWRHRLFPGYKEHRSPMPRTLEQGLADIEQAVGELGIACFSLPGFEADDIIATIAVKTARSGGHVVILSTDRIHCQLLGRSIEVYDHFAGKPLDSSVIRDKYGVEPAQLPDLLALCGDSGLSIPGVKSIGVKTASKLLGQYPNLNDLLKNAEKIPGQAGKQLRAHRQEAVLAYQLFTLKTDIELGINLNRFRYRMRIYHE